MVALFAIVTGKWGWRSFCGMAKGAVAPRLPDLDRALRPKEYKIVIGIMILCQLATGLGGKGVRGNRGEGMKTAAHLVQTSFVG